MSINNLTAHNAALLAENKPSFAFDKTKPLAPQQKAARKALLPLLRMPEKRTNPVPVVEFETEHEDFLEIRFRFESEPGFFVPAHLLHPKEARNAPLPVVICLQGHSTGMHISLGRPKFQGDEETIAGDRDFAIQAVKRGYAAVAMEQRGFGELKSEIAADRGCHHPAMQALLMGRTLLGERIFDVSRLIDVLEYFPAVDTSRIGMTGNSGGGTTAYHAACVEPRVKIAMPSCSFNLYGTSIYAMHHCSCNYIPDILPLLDMPDLAMLIAPRPLILVNGAKDGIFPLEAAKQGFAVVSDIYAASGASENCAMVVGPEGHRFYAELAWPVFDGMLARLIP